MKVAYLSPMPPVRSGVSEYSTDLLPRLVDETDLRVFAAPPAHPWCLGIAGLLVPVEQPEVFDREPFDLAIYHMGNNTHHRFVHERALRRPGLLVLHDLVLHHFHIEQTLALDAPDDYVALLERSYGRAGRDAATARVDDAASECGIFAFPLFEHLAAASRGVLVHSRRAARLIGDRIPGLPVRVAPMGVPSADRDPLPDREAARASMSLGDDELVVGMFGFTTPIKRPHEILRAFANARARLGGRARLVVVGEVAESLDLVSEACALGVGDVVTLTGYLEYDDAKRFVAAADVFVNLRYPTAGETSASLLRLLGWGKPVIVSEYAQFREMPDDVVLHASVDEYEEAELTELLVLLGERPELAMSLGANARRFVAAEHSLDRAVAGYLDFMKELIASDPGDDLDRPRVRPLGVRMTSRTPGRPRARLRAGALPCRVPPGTRLELPVEVENIGDATWLRGPFPEGGYAVLGGYLRWPDGRVVAELGWARLPRDVAPGETAQLVWRVELPEVTGSFELVVDIKIADWGFLHWRGSEALVYALTVSSSVLAS